METEGVEVAHLVEIAEQSERLRNRSFTRFVLEHALERLMRNNSDTINFEQVANNHTIRRHRSVDE